MIEDFSDYFSFVVKKCYVLVVCGLLFLLFMINYWVFIRPMSRRTDFLLLSYLASFDS